MVWAVALIVILGVGMPAVGWWLTRRPRPADSTDRGDDEIDRWLAGQSGLVGATARGYGCRDERVRMP